MTYSRIAAVLFDLDGVITDTAEYHYQAWQRLADELGRPFDRVANERFRGVGRADCLRLLLDGDIRPDFDQLLERKNTYYVELLDRLTPADILPGALALLDELAAIGLKTAIGSASANTWTVLRRLGLADRFDTVVDGSMLSRSKPDPEVFLTAAARLGVAPGLCLVVEDATAGIEAGLAANMWTLGLGPLERVGQAHAVAPSLDGLTWSAITDLVEAGTWAIRRLAGAAPDHHLETIFTIGNGHIGLRGTTPETRSGEAAASFMHAVWDDVPVSRTELANLPRWWGVDVWVNGVRLNQAAPGQSAAAWSLDLRDGVLSRRLRWSPDAATDIELTDQRLLSLDQPRAGAVRLGLTVLRGQAEVDLRAGLDGHVDNLGLRHWDMVGQSAQANAIGLRVRTRATAIDLALAAQFEASPAAALAICQADGQPAVLTSARLGPGQTLTAVKYVALASAVDSPDPVGQATSLAADLARTGWDGLRRASAAAWERAWQAMDVEIDGDPAAQLAIRYNLFQLVAAAPRLVDTSIGAKTLSGFGYRHHVFWDSEIFMLPVLTYTQPELARRLLDYRWRRLPGARRKAAAGGFTGARFPWESAGSGDEVCPTWVEDAADPTRLIRIWTGDLELHLNADIAYACWQYWRVSGDDAFLRQQGAEIILDSATFWAARAELEADGRYHYRDTMGPDEYHEHVDDNAFNNALAAWHLRLAGDVLAWLERTAPDEAERVRAALGIDQAARERWRQVADNIAQPRRRDGVLEQHDGFFDLTDVDVALARDPGRRQSMQQIYGIAGTAGTQNLKQPDVLMLAFLLPELFTETEFLANYQYYDQRTDHELGSSLGPAISAIVACRAGDAEAAYRHFQRAAQADLFDARGNAVDGIHGASAGGLWQAIVFGFAGLSLSDDGWRTQPRLPAHWTRLAFRVTRGGVTGTYTLTPHGGVPWGRIL